ncbi:MAG: T9SS type A sorting domain-containing protein [Bacteroidetes bacterium]|nr:T9SS type A sorting domain-containing protein [Bacteroidota bacterium]
MHEENPHSINASGCYATNFNLASLDDNNDSTTQVYLYDTNFVFMELPISTPLINYTITQATLCSTGYADAEEAFTRISMYPNPVTDLINFELKNGREKQIIKININSAQGSLLLTKIFYESSFQMDLKKFTPSLYLVEIIINGQFVSMQKIIKI